MAHGPAKNVLVDLWLASGLARLQVEQLLAFVCRESLQVAIV